MSLRSLQASLPRLLVAAVACGLAAGCGVRAQAHSPRRTGTPGLVRSAEIRVKDPPDFVYVTGDSLRPKVELRSPKTGRLVKVLATFGESFTNNGLAQSPDGRAVYVTLNGPSCRRTLEIERIATASGRRALVGCGQQQAISPNGRLLAYATGPRFKALTIRDLATGARHTIALRRLLGNGMDLQVGANTTWLRDGSEVVAMPQWTPVAVSGAARVGLLRPVRSRSPRLTTLPSIPPGPRLTTPPSIPRPKLRSLRSWPSRPRPGRPGSCSTSARSSLCLIVVRIGKSGQPLYAKRVIVRGIPALPGVDVLAGDGSAPRSLLIGEEEAHRTVIDRASLAGRRPTATRLLSLPPVLPMAFDARGDHLFYVVGHGPTALWLARMGRGRLIGAHRLPGNPGGPVAW